MDNKFELPLLNNKKNKKKHSTFVHLMASFLLIIMGIVTCMMIAVLKDTVILIQNKSILLGVGVGYILFGIILLLITIFFNQKIADTATSNKLRIIEILVLLPTVIYSIINKWYVPAAYAGIGIAGIIYAYFWEQKQTIQQFVSVTESGVTIPNTKVGFLKWQEIKRLIYRNSILTVDCRNNKLYQLDIKNDEIAFNNDNFEQFCEELIQKHKDLVKKDW